MTDEEALDLERRGGVVEAQSPYLNRELRSEREAALCRKHGTDNAALASMLEELETVSRYWRENNHTLLQIGDVARMARLAGVPQDTVRDWYDTAHKAMEFLGGIRK